MQPPSQFSSADAIDLARLLEMSGDSGGQQWSADDLGVILTHQLAAPLRAELTNFDSLRTRQIWRQLAEQADSIATFRDLFTHPNPPVSLLRLVKRFAKSNLKAGDGPIPEEVGRVLYYACVAVARSKCNESISDLTPEALLVGLEWCLDQVWLDAPLRSLFGETSHLLREERPPSDEVGPVE